MSGYKHATVTISQEEYQRLQQADVKKKFKEFTKMTNDDRNRDEMMLNLIQQLETRERQLQEQLGSIVLVTSQNDDELLMAILEQNSSYYEDLANALNDSNSTVNHAISSLSEEFSRVLEIDRDQYNRNIQNLLMIQDTYLYREYAKDEAAQLWLNRCLILADFIQNQFDHERFTPGKISRILRNLSYAESNFASGFSESSLQGAQQIYLDLSDLNFELEQLLLQWQMAFEKTYYEINLFIQQMDSNASVCAIGIKGEELPNQVDLDFWTNGRYLQLLDHCRQLSTYMSQDQNILTLDDIDRIYSQILPVIREAFESIIYEARLNALNSQLRMNIAEKALYALESHGFSLANAGYKDEDMRSQFNACLECPDGSQVSIQVLPGDQSTQELTNELVVITTHPYLKTEHEARLHWEELNQTLCQYNLKVSRPEIRSTPGLDTPEQFKQPDRIEKKLPIR